MLVVFGYQTPNPIFGYHGCGCWTSVRMVVFHYFIVKKPLPWLEKAAAISSHNFGHRIRSEHRTQRIASVSALEDEENVEHEVRKDGDIVISMILARRDTVSAMMTWLLWLLLKHWEEEALLLKEIYYGNNRCEGLDYECLKEMKLLKTCL